ncbi:hypothetical protein EIM48_11045 [Pseudoxanthomonas sp. SGNA-20]|uniref:KGGVGR-motif variant AAA ATPase n=1 Tax=Pseudoxanthomonas sp. SGNA-20 TaxID=2493088 RepID=UPI000F63BC32|nr:AAA family ATPase [Pseudoxanthomonas sp. SGNA-20]RRN55651.1 hypothetical protein EIM48_11045 [Pseudoxanthomonas sp. SGNA-20]
MSTILFDESLTKFCELVVAAGADDFLKNGAFVRSPSGQLQLVVNYACWNEALAVDLRPVVAGALGKYSATVPDNIIRDVESPLVNERHLILPERVILGGQTIFVRLVDKRAAGQDWLRKPRVEDQDGPPRMVFWSLKGGVGRTTALVALAASIARGGGNVLVLDLDLEAPGVGDQLLKETERPKFGVVDYLLEDAVGNIDLDAIVGDVVGVSTLVEGAGLIHVCPAAGLVSVTRPENYLAKLFRAYRADGGVRPLSSRISMLIDSLVDRRRYDAVLIDARAGLNESTAAAVLGLNADVLLFGHKTLQTFSGYRYALAHLSRFVTEEDGEWRLRLKMVHAKAAANSSAQDEFRDQAFELFSEWLYDQTGDFSFSLDDDAAPHASWIILDDSNYRDFDPVDSPDLLTGRAFDATFGAFIDAARERLRIR